MKAVFNENRHEQLLNILAQGGFVNEYVDLCRRYSSYGDFDDRPKLDFARTVELFKARDPSAKALKKWRMIEFGRESIGRWVWTGSLVVKRYDGLDPMMEGVSEDGTESVGSNWISLTNKARMFLPEAVRPSHEDFGRPHFDGSMQTMERMVPDLLKLFQHVKEIIRHGWANQAPSGEPLREQALL